MQKINPGWKRKGHHLDSKIVGGAEGDYALPRIFDKEDQGKENKK